MDRRTENILESITYEFFAVDRQWRFTYINDRALHRVQRTYGQELTREELLGKNCWEMLPESVRCSTRSSTKPCASRSSWSSKNTPR